MSERSNTIPAFNAGAAFVRAGRALLSHGWIPMLLAIVAGVVIIGIGACILALVMAINGEKVAGRTSVNAPWAPYLMLACWAAICSTAQMLAAHSVHQARIGEKARISATFRGLWLDGPLAFLLLLAQWLIVGIGLILLVIPGLIFAVLFAMVLPARVANGGGPIRAFQESLNAARGNGWMLALYLLLANALGAGVVFVGNKAVDWSTTSFATFATANEEHRPLVIGLGVVVAIATVAYAVICPFLFGLFPAAAYAELKAAHDDRVAAGAFD